MDPWEKEGPPDADPHLGARRKVQLVASFRDISNDAMHPYFLGELLANVHASNWRYTDLHKGNVGVRRAGGYVILDPGGSIRCPINAQEMSGDFVVPFAEMSDPEIAAFVLGYYEHVAINLEGAHPGFAEEVLRRIGVDGASEWAADASRPPAIFHDILGEKRGEAHTCESEEAQDLLFAILVMLIHTSDAARDDKDVAIVRAAAARGQATPDLTSPTWLAALRLSQAGRKLAEALQDHVGNSGSSPSELESGALVFWPTSYFATQVSALVEEVDASDITAALVEAYSVLARLARRHEGTHPRGAFINAMASAFHLATPNNADWSNFEKRHRRLMACLQDKSGVPHASFAGLPAGQPMDVMMATSLFYQVARFELAVFGASIDLAGSRTLLWNCYVTSLEAARRQLISIHLALKAGDDDRALQFLRAQALQGLEAIQHAFRLLTHPKVRVPPPVLGRLFGRNAGEELDWLKKARSVFADERLSHKDAIEVLERGAPFFSVSHFAIGRSE